MREACSVMREAVILAAAGGESDYAVSPSSKSISDSSMRDMKLTMQGAMQVETSEVTIRSECMRLVYLSWQASCVVPGALLT
jgi:hypothetical protein